MSSTAAALRLPNRFIDLLNKSVAIFNRDRRLAMSYDMAFYIQWAQIVVQVIANFFLAQFVHPNVARFGLPTFVTYFDIIVINLAFLRFQQTAIQSFQTAIRGDQMLGTLEVLLATPTPLAVIVLSTGLWGFALTGMQVGFALIVASAFGLHLHVNILTALVFIILTIACMSPLGVLAASTIMTFKQNAPTSFVAGGVAMILGGVMYPVSSLPAPLQVVSWFLPISHALVGIRGGLLVAAPLSDPTLAYNALWLLAATAILLPLSLYSFTKAVNLARRDGTLGQY
jgi:ABC-2 type transport system permease protein